MGVEKYTKRDGTEGQSAKIVADEVGISTKSATAIVNKIYKDGASVPGISKGMPESRPMSEVQTDAATGKPLEAPF